MNVLKNYLYKFSNTHLDLELQFTKLKNSIQEQHLEVAFLNF